MTDVQRDLTWLAFLLWEAEDVMIYLYCWFSVLCSEVCSKCCSCFSELMPEFYVPFPHIPPTVAVVYFGWVWRVSHLSSKAMPPDHISTIGIAFFTVIHLYFRQSSRTGLVLKNLWLLVIFYNDAQGRELYGGSRNINILPIQGS